MNKILARSKIRCRLSGEDEPMTVAEFPITKIEPVQAKELFQPGGIEKALAYVRIKY